MVKNLKEFDINLFSLKNKEHYFNYELDHSFFSCFENSPISKGTFKVDVDLLKGDALIETNFRIKGQATLECDVSLEDFEQAFDLDEGIIFKFSDTSDTVSDDLVMIKSEQPILNLAHYIYELIVLAIPLKKVHPSYMEDDNDDESESILRYSDVDDSEERIEEVDPRWDALKKLKN